MRQWQQQRTHKSLFQTDELFARFSETNLHICGHINKARGLLRFNEVTTTQILAGYRG
jgi:hypothetical protein